jgi:hypothetical protein
MKKRQTMSILLSQTQYSQSNLLSPSSHSPLPASSSSSVHNLSTVRPALGSETQITHPSLSKLPAADNTNHDEEQRKAGDWGDNT